jgi:hypothetical protein
VASFAERLRFAYCEEGMRNESGKALNLGRHKRCCKICSHEKREEIEQDFIAWKSPIAIAEEYGLADRMNVYRHANALGLFEKRRRNIRAATHTSDRHIGMWN